MDYSAKTAAELARLCVTARDEYAWEEFRARFHRPIALTVTRVAASWRSAESLEDLVQEVYLKLFLNDAAVLRRLAGLNEDVIPRFLRVVAANAVRDRLRSGYSEKRGGNEAVTELTDESTVNFPRQSKDIEQSMLLIDVRRTLASCATGEHAERDQLVFWLYYRTGLTSAAISRLPGISLTTKGVESVILRLTRTLRAAISRRVPSTSEGI